MRSSLHHFITFAMSFYCQIPSPCSAVFSPSPATTSPFAFLLMSGLQPASPIPSSSPLSPSFPSHADVSSLSAFILVSDRGDVVFTTYNTPAHLVLLLFYYC
jgi:hypothetical protein